jgi:hypothetical protein
MEVHKLTNQALRLAVGKNQVSFPAQIPVFEKQSRPDIQWRIVQLYFVRRWSFGDIGRRYRLTPQRVIQIANVWRIRAVALGYIQEIMPEDPIQALQNSTGEWTGIQPDLPASSAGQPELTAGAEVAPVR